ncbi:MAG: mechanosensitive ion channel [Phycisphaerales bacterium]|nr:MAG: mechanosensitive ion channel [Phycisphaerales bacterium]
MPSDTRHARCGFLAAMFVVLAVSPGPVLGADSEASDKKATAKTTADPWIPVGELELLLKPLTKDELVVEAEGWIGLLKAKVSQISQAEIAVKRKNRQIDEAQASAAELREQAEQVPTEAEGSRPPTDAPAQEAPAEKGLEHAAQRVEQQAKAHREKKTVLLEDLNKLREERTALTDRTNVVLAALKEKGGEVAEYEQYIKAVSGIIVDVSDTAYVWTAVLGWLKSKEGGIRWGKNIVLFFVMLIVFWIIAKIVEAAVRKAFSVTRKGSDLLRDFTTKFVRRLILLIGLMVAVTMLEINIGPVLAVVGAAGFVIAFALQGTLSNFASGLMILAYRPFDVGDAVNVAGVAGSVESMNLVSTYIKTFDNQRVIVPNNSIWGGVITNITGLPTRRVDMVFGIGYSDDASKAKGILEDILKNHPKVLNDPAPVVELHELGDSSVNFICRPWTKTSDYWAVYWDVTREAKERFDAAGISIPFPQRDVHIHQVPAAKEPAAARA